MNAYGPDLAHIHDVGFGGYARAVAPWLLGALREAGIHDGLVAELGCGSGILAEELATAGYDVWGVDISPAMIDICRDRLPAGEFHIGSLLKKNIPPCNAVAALGECLNYLFDPDAGEGQLGPLFERVHAALRPGGIFVCDVAEPGRGSGPAAAHRVNEDWAVLVDCEENATKRMLTRDITLFRRDGDLYRRSHEIHRLRLYPASQVETRLRETGFDVRRIESYGDEPLPHHIAVFLATKRLA